MKTLDEVAAWLQSLPGDQSDAEAALKFMQSQAADLKGHVSFAVDQGNEAYKRIAELEAIVAGLAAGPR